MFQVLLESAGARPARRGGWTLASTMTHAGLVTAAVVLTMRVEPAPGVPDAPVIPPVYVPVPRPPVDASRPRTPGTVIPDGLPIEIVAPPLPTIDATLPPGPVVLSAGAIFGERARPDSAVPGLASAPHRGVYTPTAVERVVAPLPGNRNPDYPGALRRAGVEGEVLVAFIVDAGGRVERGSINVISATHPQFADAVTAWLPRTRYSPAQVGGQPVRQLVQQRVDFTLRGAR